MKIVVISDTHGEHEKLGRLAGDVLIHCGDFESIFSRNSVSVYQIDEWFGRQQFERIYCIGGNHDFRLVQEVAEGRVPFRNAIWLHERSDVFRGVTFYGASWVPMLHGFAFFADDEFLERAWSRIPEDVDVLITHTPPLGILDVSSRGKSLGCRYLADRLKDLSPTLHCFGHVHRSRGTTTKRPSSSGRAVMSPHNFSNWVTGKISSWPRPHRFLTSLRVM